MSFTLPGLTFSLLTGLALAVYYTLNKKIAPAGRPLPIIFWIYAAHLPPLLLWLLSTRGLHVTGGYFLPGLSVMGLSILGNLAAIRGLTLSPLTLVIPVMCLSPVFTSLAGIPLLGEWPTGQQWAGIGLAVSGILCLYAPADRPWHILSFWPRFFQEKGALYMTLSALCWSLCAPMDKLAMRAADPPFHAAFVFTGITLFLLIWLTVRGEWRRGIGIRSGFYMLLLAAGCAGAAADILQLLSLQQAEAGPFEAIKRVSSQVAVLFLGALLFREELTKPKLIGVGILSVGLPLIVL